MSARCTHRHASRSCLPPPPDSCRPATESESFDDDKVQRSHSIAMAAAARAQQCRHWHCSSGHFSSAVNGTTCHHISVTWHQMPSSGTDGQQPVCIACTVITHRREVNNKTGKPVLRSPASPMPRPILSAAFREQLRFLLSHPCDGDE